MAKKEMPSIWTEFEVTWDFLTRLVSSVPADPEIVKRWLESRKPPNRPPDSRSIDEIANEVMETLPEENQENGMHVFQRQEGGLVVRMSTVRAHLKDCARILSRLYVGKLEKESSFAVKVINSLYYPPDVYWLPILSQLDDKQIKAPTGEYDQAVHAQTPRGPISALKRFEFINDARLKFKLLVLTPKSGKPVVGEDDLQTLFAYGGVHGYAGERGAGEGRYVATVTRIEN